MFKHEIGLDYTDIVKSRKNKRQLPLIGKLPYKFNIKKLVEEYNWTSLVYESRYNFQPILGEPYYLYEDEYKNLFLSLISPNEWSKSYIGTFKLLNNGKWEKI